MSEENSKALLKSLNQEEKKAPPSPRVLIQIPHYKGTMRIELSRFLIIQALTGRLVGSPFVESRPWDSTRNVIAKDFREVRRDYTHVLMIDSDVVPPHNVLDMAHLDLDVVGSLCFSFQEGRPFALALKKVKNGYQQLQEIPSGQVIEVDAIGAGCIMIHRRVLEAVPPPWFQFDYNEFGIQSGGEDFWFCRKIKEYGFKVYVHTGLISSHFADIDLLQINNLLGAVQQETRQDVRAQLEEGG